jgi:NAD(P)-dependent dehydrogenase (short-subunit alcohol dehydrogenase family)
LTDIKEEIGFQTAAQIRAHAGVVQCPNVSGRLGTADDVAYGMLYLASDESAYVTRAELVIDGGATAQ